MKAKMYVLTGLIAFAVGSALGSWPTVPDFQVISGTTEVSRQYFVRVDNRSKTMEVRYAKDLKEYWSTTIPDYLPPSSLVALSEDGQRLVHVRGDYGIRSLDQECIQVFDKRGKRLSYALREFFDDLKTIKFEHRTSVLPDHHWREGINWITKDRIGIALRGKRHVVVSILEKRVIIGKRAVQQSEPTVPPKAAPSASSDDQ